MLRPMAHAPFDAECPPSIAPRIRRAYLLALTIVALLCIGVHEIERQALARFAESARVIDVSGKQRMLSQRIAIFAAQYAEARNAQVEAMAAAHLREARDAFVEGHAWVRAHAPLLGGGGRMTGATRAMFEDAPHRVNARVDRYVAATDALLATTGEAKRARHAAIHFDAIAPLPRALDALVKQLARDAEAQVAANERLKTWLLVLTLLVLAAELAFIFAPLARAVELRTQELETARDDLAHAALHDPLTGLPNRRLLDEILTSTSAQARRAGRMLTVCRIDLDRFKRVNDTLGHAIGDAVLVRATAVLRHATRESDFVARVGGDEFVVVDTMLGGSQGAERMAERIVEQIAAPMTIDGHEIRIGASVGIATTRDRDLAALLERADVALYQAKAQGRGRVEHWSDDAQEAFEGRQAA